MTDHDAFLEAIVERSDDDTPRLMYADWLMERDDPRGEFIRVQCELRRRFPGYKVGLTVDGVTRKLVERQEELLSDPRHFINWTPSLLHTGPGAGIRWDHGSTVGLTGKGFVSAEFRRGFVSHVALPHDAFLEHAAALFCAAPIEAVTLSDMKPRILGTTAAWHRGYRFRTPDPEDLDPAIWDCLALAVEKREPWCWYDTVEEANADLSSACVKLGRKRAAKLKKERVKS